MDHSGSLEEESRNPGHCGGCGDASEQQCSRSDDQKTARAACVVEPPAELFTDLEQFLRAIHPGIVDKVQPVESGLLDVLCEVDGFSSEDEQFIREGGTRREKARRFSSRLCTITEEDFMTFLPELKKKYPHVVAEREFQPKDCPASAKCLRHALKKRINLKRLLDIIYGLSCCCQDEYDQLHTVQYCGEKEWNQVFQLLQKHASKPQLCQSIKNLLRKKKFNGLERFEEAVLNGFTCTCFTSNPTCLPPELSATPQPLPSDAQTMPLRLPTLPSEPCHQPSKLLASFEGPSDWPKEFDNHLETDRDTLGLPKETDGMEKYFNDFKLHDEGSSAPYPSSAASSKHHESAFECSDSGISETIFQPVFDNNVQFHTFMNKNKYREVLGLIDESLTDAACTRTNLRFLEMIQNDTRTLSKPAKDEADTNTNAEKLRKLLANARTSQGNIEELYKRVLRTWQNVEDLEKYLGFECPANWNSLLMIRYHLLRNEVRECQHIAEKTHEIFEQIREICQPNCQPQ